MNISVIVGFLALLYSVDALTCKTCMYMEGTSDHDVMKMILDALTKSSQQDCKKDPENAVEEECGQLPDDKDAWRCGTGDVRTSLTQQISGSDESLRADLHFISRGCAAVNADDDKYSAGCHPAAHYKDDIMVGIGDQPGGPVLGDLSGQFCVCGSDNCNNNDQLCPPGDSSCDSGGGAGKTQPVLLVLVVAVLALVLPKH